MATTFNLKIITPDRIVLDTEVEEVSARAIDGELSVLPNHEPLVTALAIAPVVFKRNGVNDAAAVIGGILEVGTVIPAPPPGSKEPQRPVTEVTILSDIAELGAEIDAARAKQAAERAQALKSQKHEIKDTLAAEMALSRALARQKAVDIAKLKKKHGI